MVLAGGQGTRLRATVPNRAKVLAPVAGEPFLKYVLAWLAQQGVSEVVLCLGHLAQQVMDEAPALASRGQRLHFSVEESPQGTAGALRLARTWVRQRVLVLNGDSLPVVRVQDMLRTHLAAGVLCTLAVARVPDASRFGTVDVDTRGRVHGFRPQGGQSSALVNAGVYVLERGAWDHLNGKSLEQETLPTWAADGRVAAFTDGVRFLDMGTPEGYAAMQALIGGQSN